jgi:hypothetical protein
MNRKILNMKTLFSAVLALTISTAANAGGKIAEYNDYYLGNSYGGCSISQTYGTGGRGYEYKEFTVNCPNDTVKVGTVSGSYVSNGCRLYIYTSGYSVSGSCSNWRVYKN